MIQKLKANPRTTLAGLAAILSPLLLAFGVVTPAQAAAVASAITGLGLLLAGDAK